MSQLTPEPVSDVEWMLQSGKIDHQALTRLLIEEHYTQIGRLAQAMLNDDEFVPQAIVDIISHAVLRADEYKGQIEAKNWLFRIALPICYKYRTRLHRQRASSPNQPKCDGETDLCSELEPGGIDRIIWKSIDDLDNSSLASVLLYTLFGLSISQVAQVQDKSEEYVRSQLQTTFDVIIHSIQACQNIGDHSDEIDNDEFRVRIVQFIQKHWPEMAMSPIQSEILIKDVLERVRKLEFQHRIVIASKEALLIGLVILVLLGGLLGLGELFPEQASFSASLLQPTVSPSPHARVMYMVRMGDQLDSIAASLGINAENLLDENWQVIQGEIRPGQLIYIPIDQISQPTDLPGVATPAPGQDAITGRSTSDEIKQRIANSSASWSTLWADVLVTFYGPQSYIGPAIVERVQTWIVHPGYAFQIVGSSNEAPESIYRYLDGLIFIENPGSEPLLLDIHAQDPDHPLLGSQVLNQMIFPDIGIWMEESGEFRALDEERVSGRTVVIVEWINSKGVSEYRLWIDSKTGVLLRVQKYGGPDLRTLTLDAVATAIVYDEDIPGELFDLNIPWRSGYAEDHLGRVQSQSITSEVDEVDNARESRTPLVYLSLPDGYDLSNSILTFQYAQALVEPQAIVESPVSGVSLFADGYYLGDISLSSPETVSCYRSPDGARIVFLNGGAELNPNNLFWINLSDPSKMYRPLSYMQVDKIAFSADGRYLAIFAIDLRSQTTGLYRLDVATGDVVLLIELAGVQNIVWDPSGQYVALIGRVDNNESDDSLIVIRIPTSQIVYRQSLDESSHTLPEGWSGEGWGIVFTDTFPGLDTCAYPSEN